MAYALVSNYSVEVCAVHDFLLSLPSLRLDFSTFLFQQTSLFIYVFYRILYNICLWLDKPCLFIKREITRFENKSSVFFCVVIFSMYLIR